MLRARSRTSGSAWSSPTVSTRMRGVITSAAVRSAKRSVRSRNEAVCASSVPSCAERRTSEESSSGLRAPEISSLASMPTRASTPLENPFRTRIAGLNTVLNTSWGRASARPITMGSAMDMFLGISSPRSIESRVATTIATTSETVPTTPAGSPIWSSGGSMRRLIAGSIT